MPQLESQIVVPADHMQRPSTSAKHSGSSPRAVRAIGRTAKLPGQLQLARRPPYRTCHGSTPVTVTGSQDADHVSDLPGFLTTETQRTRRRKDKETRISIVLLVSLSPPQYTLKQTRGPSQRFYWRNLPNLQSGDIRMVTKTRKRKFAGSKKRFVGKPTGQIQERVQAVGPEHFGIVAVDCAKRRSKWMLCNFYGKVLVEPTSVEHTTGGLRAMTQSDRGGLPSGRIDRHHRGRGDDRHLSQAGPASVP